MTMIHDTHVLNYNGQDWTHSTASPPPVEISLNLTVNNRQLVALTASNHDLKNLVIGFLRLQGFINKPDEIISLGLCLESNNAVVHIKKDIPDDTQATRTSGCGVGVTLSHSLSPVFISRPPQPEAKQIEPRSISSDMKELSRNVSMYHKHGGMHSAAVFNDNTLLLMAEDIGRHNTIDRIAGEAFLKGISLQGCRLVTSGRISSEMAIKASILGIEALYSRTSPTDMAIQICKERGVTLVGYVRNNNFTVYSWPERLATGDT